ncbi:hypothetical protein EDD85DRAFT_798386 [Armillaria nabsnona]|nr:hypothetical protein EDD85DRAFT_798386 [Armillaria nabsnona]
MALFLSLVLMVSWSTCVLSLSSIPRAYHSDEHYTSSVLLSSFTSNSTYLVSKGFTVESTTYATRLQSTFGSNYTECKNSSSITIVKHLVNCLVLAILTFDSTCGILLHSTSKTPKNTTNAENIHPFPNPNSRLVDVKVSGWLVDPPKYDEADRN